MKKMLAALLCAAALLSVPALAAGPYAVEVDGKPLDLGSLVPYEENGRVMLPLRLVAEALGFTVTWDQESRAATLDDGTVKSAVTIGADRYSLASSQALGLTAPQSFGAAPALVEGVTFVPSELFTLLCGQASVGDGVVSLHSAAHLPQVPNPMRRCADFQEAAGLLGFAPPTPAALPKGYEVSTLWVIGGDLLEVRYHAVGGDISFRAAKGNGDISGDYRVFSSVANQKADGVEYTLKGDGEKVSLVLWTRGEYSFSLSLSPALDAADALAVAGSVGQG